MLLCRIPINARYFSHWFDEKNDNDTIFIFLSDHGFRMGGSFSKTQQGKVEHRNPTLVTYLSNPAGSLCRFEKNVKILEIYVDSRAKRAEK